MVVSSFNKDSLNVHYIFWQWILQHICPLSKDVLPFAHSESVVHPLFPLHTFLKTPFVVKVFQFIVSLLCTFFFFFRSAMDFSNKSKWNHTTDLYESTATLVILFLIPLLITSSTGFAFFIISLHCVDIFIGLSTTIFIFLFLKIQLKFLQVFEVRETPPPPNCLFVEIVQLPLQFF